MDVVDVRGQYLVLLVLHGAEVSRLDISLHHRRHAADNHVLPDKIGVPAVNSVRHGFHRVVEFLQRGYRVLCDTTRPEELLKIHGMHHNLTLVPDRNGLRLAFRARFLVLVLYAEQ